MERGLRNPDCFSTFDFSFLEFLGNTLVVVYVMLLLFLMTALENKGRLSY